MEFAKKGLVPQNNLAQTLTFNHTLFAILYRKPLLLMKLMIALTVQTVE